MNADTPPPAAPPPLARNVPGYRESKRRKLSGLRASIADKHLVPVRPVSETEEPSEIYRGFLDCVKTEDFFSRALQAYLSALGDVDKAADYLGCTREIIQEEVTKGGWDKRLRDLMEVREKRGAAEYARQVNRLMNLTQSVRIRALVDVVLKRVTTDEASLQYFLSIPTKFGRTFSAKAMVELAKAAQIAQQCTYAALADQTSERLFAKRNEPDGEETAPQLSVFKALTQLAHGRVEPRKVDGEGA